MGILIFIVFFSMIFWFFKIISWVINGVSNSITNSATNTLITNFQSLGDLRGKTYDEISSVIGACNQEQFTHFKTGEPATRRIWNATNYKISMIFDSNNVFHHIE